MNSLSKNLKTQMNMLAMTQTTLAKRAGVSQVLVSQLLKGSRSTTAKTVLTLASVLNCTPGWLAFDRDASNALKNVNQASLSDVTAPSFNEEATTLLSTKEDTGQQMQPKKQKTEKNSIKINLENNVISITPREVECLEHCIKGMTAKETGEHLGISKRTVENHLARIKTKFNCSKKSCLIIKLLDVKEFTDEIGLYQDKEDIAGVEPTIN